MGAVAGWRTGEGLLGSQLGTTLKHLSFLFANTFMCIISFEPHKDSIVSILEKKDKDEESKSSVSGLHSLSA